MPERLTLVLAALPDGWDRSAVGRRTACEDNPALFALVYLRHWLKSSETDDRISFAEPHLQWCELAQRWADRTPIAPGTDRHLFVAPRALGKTSWWFGIIPLWLAAYGHRKFVAAFAHRSDQSEQHLEAFRRELDTNRLLLSDFPELCAPLIRSRRHTVADNRAMLQTASGFAFAARGIDAASLGLKVGTHRPDLIILDDVEPDEANYSAHSVEKRLGTITDSILALNIYAPVVWTGTTTMNGSLVHQAIQSGTEPELAPWVAEEGWQVHHHLPVLTDPDTAERRSVWPEKWPLAYLDSISGTRAYAKNYLNLPLALDGDYWSPEDIRFSERADFARTVIAVDPAVTAKRTSDYTGLTVASSTFDGHVVIRECIHVKLPPAGLRGKVAHLMEQYPEARVLLVETTQGGDTWRPIFEGLPIKYREDKPKASKDTRITWLLNAMQRRKVSLGKRLPVLEGQMLAYPAVANDDALDSACLATVGYLCPPLSSVGNNRATSRTASYV
jgi:phage terminase large subunit-like protein